MAPGVGEISPLCVAVTGLDEGRPAEDADIRDAVDRALKAHGKLSVHTVANTIFPASRWKKPELGHQVLFERYAKMLPAITKADPQRNRNGTYFERMTAFGPDKTNQLKHIIDTYAGGNRRRSALQAVIFDPAKDHTDQPQRGFPCLQYVSFAPFDKIKLRVTGVYATQYLFEKAYGNYVGLYNLGRFMAYELGLELAQLNCIASVAKRGAPSKESLRGLADELKEFLGEPEGETSTQGAVA
jgi:hypothetical protein